jgi:nitronate monooxygenase
MTLTTAFTELFGVRHPIALAPMGGSAGGALAAAVSNGGGLGLLGSGNGDREWLARELPLVVEGTSQPWGVGFQSWAIDSSVVEYVLGFEPRAVMLSFGDPRPFAGIVRESGTTLIIQVTDLDEARQAVDVGADVIVAQGTEAGGHGARRGWSTLAFVPAVVDLVAPVPVLAAGGIADGRQVAAALALGAQGVWCGSVWLTTEEAETHPVVKEKFLRASSADTIRSRAKTGKPARQLRSAWTEEWDRPDTPDPLPMPLQGALIAEAEARIARTAASSDGARQLINYFVGQVVGQMDRSKPATQVLMEMVEGYIDAATRIAGTVTAAAGQDA